MYPGRVAQVVTDAIEAARWLRDATRTMDAGPPVAVTYNPLDYAWEPHRAYLERYAGDRKKVLLVGMNPGAWGMGQNGVPFGERTLVGEWLGLAGIPVGRPPRELPNRPVTGWECRRSEASGKRLWGFLKETYGTPERALRDLLIVNHCPLLMFDANGTNITPDKLRQADRDRIGATGDAGLLRMVDALRPSALIGIGAYAEQRCRAVAEGRDLDVSHIPHPSPASPLANREGGLYWRRHVEGTFRAFGLL